ncbi:MAG TPA: Arc family DNA-binding protein [Catalimonadaceae bacterium]|nr:Arc family DNA-binding protein [Catalimonadaceae bacterium]
MAGKKNFVLRIQDDMYADLEAWAAQEFRSVNGQIEFLLHKAIQERKGRKTKSETPKSDPSN